MKNIFKTLFCAIAVSLTIAACSSNKQSESDSEAATETNTGDTAVVLDNDSPANPPTVVDSLNN